MYGERSRRRGRYKRSNRGRAIIQSTTFRISEDNTTFAYPKCSDVTPDPKLLEDFKSSLRVIGFYSVDEEKNFLNDKSCLKFIDKNKIPGEFNAKFVNFDLSVAEEAATSYTGTAQQIFFNLLQWIKLEKKRVSEEFGAQEKENEESLGPDFVCAKNTLTNIFYVPYTFSEDVKFYASSINGTLYLSQDTSPVNEFNFHKVRDSKWAHKFKQYMCGEDVHGPTFPNKDFRAVIKSSIGPFSFLYSASTDCADIDSFDEENKDLGAFFKLKTTTITEYDVPKFTSRVCFYLYFYCLTTTTTKAIVGYGRKSKVTYLKMYTQEELRLMCTRERDCDPAYPFIYAIRLLAFVKVSAETEPGSVFSFTKNAYEAFFTAKKEEDMEGILPDWFYKRDE